MDLHGGSERRTKRSSTDVWEEDRLSSLSDDLLRHILRCLPSTTDAAQTSLLSRRWVRLWVGIPEIWFPGPAVPGRVHAALAAYAAHAGAPIHGIHVTTLAVHPDSNTALRLAAPLLSGELSVIHDQPLGAEDVVENLGVVELPCLENATKVELRLGRLGLAVPESGIFAKLEMLYLKGVRFHGPCEIGDAVSSARCPSLRRLTVSDAQGVHNLNISLQSLVSVELWHLQGLQQLTVVATMLEGFYLSTYFIEEKLSTVNISAPRLEKLTWVGRFEPRFLQRAHLQELGTTVTVHGPALASHHLRLFRHFEFVSLHLLLIYPRNSVNSYKYSMDGVTFLPDMKNLVLSFISGAHTFGACVFHLLRLCAGIRRLKLMLLPREVKFVPFYFSKVGTAG
ncbi:unnamed protein product [Alopecurus aequalis]